MGKSEKKVGKYEQGLLGLFRLYAYWDHNAVGL